MAAERARAARVRALNDRMRSDGPCNLEARRWVVTFGVLVRGPDFVATVVRAIEGFSDFTEDNDPHGEHDFGSVAVGDQRVCWKIDYYDRSLSGGSPDPGDEALTCRVLTIMFASEY